MIETFLIAAIEALGQAFGADLPIHIRVQASGDERILKLVVLVPEDFAGDPKQALRAFDEAWWLRNCHRTNGALVFDYEISEVPAEEEWCGQVGDGCLWETSDYCKQCEFRKESYGLHSRTL